MPPTHTDEGLRGAVAIRDANPDVGVLVLSQYAEVGVALELLLEEAAGVGYMLKDRVGDAKGTRSHGSAAAARRSTPRSSTRSSRVAAATIRSKPSRLVSAKSWA
jgi:hypothetical protein